MSIETEVAGRVVKIIADGSEAALKLTGRETKKLASCVVTAFRRKDQSIGSRKLCSMLRSGKACTLKTYDLKDMDRFRKCVNEYGIEYVVIRNRKEKEFDAIFKTDDLARMERAEKRYDLSSNDSHVYESVREMERVKEKEPDTKRDEMVDCMMERYRPDPQRARTEKSREPKAELIYENTVSGESRTDASTMSRGLFGHLQRSENRKRKHVTYPKETEIQNTIDLER